MKHIVALLVGLIPLVILQPSGKATEVKDTVKILNITTANRVVRGVENEFTVEVEYNLESEQEGELQVGFNSDKPTSFIMKESLIVKGGTSLATIKAKVIPPDWGERAKFEVIVNLSKYPHDMKWRPLAADKKAIAVEQ